MAQNPWYFRRKDFITLRKVKKWLIAFNEENEHLMYLSEFKNIQKALENLQKQKHIKGDNEIFCIASTRCIASISPKYLLKVKDGLRIYLSNFMLKTNHDIDGLCVCFRKVRLLERELKTLNGNATYMFAAIHFKLLYINLKKDLIIQSKIVEIGSKEVTLDLLGILKGIILKNESKIEFSVIKSKKAILLKDKRKFHLNELVPFQIEEVCCPESGYNIIVVGSIC